MNWRERERKGVGREGGRHSEKLSEGRRTEGKEDACVAGSFSVLAVGSSKGQGQSSSLDPHKISHYLTSAF